MNNIENISVVVMEECAELQQAISKSLRFGYNENNPLTPETNNAKDILTEFYQLQAMMEMLISEAHLSNCFTLEEEFAIKNEKMNKFLEYQKISKKLGNLE